MAYSIEDEMFDRIVIRESDFGEGLLPEDMRHGYPVGSDTFSKHDSVAALIAWVWSLDGATKTSGDAQYGNGWHVLFRDERVILHEGNSGAVTAWRVDAGEDLDEVWGDIEKGAVYPDDEEEEDGPVCEGHHDDDRALLAGPYYCDGSCAA